MCGILAIISSDSHEPIYQRGLIELIKRIDRRGPDFRSEIEEINQRCGIDIRVRASVLHIRGDILGKQPSFDKFGNCLLFNGQIYGFSGQPLERRVSDTIFLSQKLELCDTKDQIAQVFSHIEGPFALIYWHHRTSSLFFGRDIFGRKSLCELTGSDLIGSPIILSSVCQTHDLTGCGVEKNGWKEVSCDGYHCLDFSESHPRRFHFLKNLDGIYPRTNKCIDYQTPFSEKIILSQSYGIAPLNHDSRRYDEFSKTDRELAVNQFEKILMEVVTKRVDYNRMECLDCRRSDSSCSHSKVSVAFSGGVDSTLLALMVDKAMDESETIDLITVAFKKGAPDRQSVGGSFKELRKLCPQRNWRLVICDISESQLEKSRQSTIRHLISPCDTIVDDSLGCACWFVSQANGRALDSSMDDESFEKEFDGFLEFSTSKGENSPYINSDLMRSEYCSPAAIVFAGMGIDEQLGGYSAHRAAWAAAGTAGLLSEISFQMRRISHRNMGRDDRVFTDHSRDVKLPFLDAELVSFLNRLPLGLKMNLDEPLEIGPKKLLRELAHKLGLNEASRRPKRALQFGTRIANSSEVGGQVSSRLK